MLPEGCRSRRNQRIQAPSGLTTLRAASTMKPMKVLVVGADGRTGRLVVEGAEACGHHVTALVRAADELVSPVPKRRLIIGDVLDGGVVSDAVDGAEAVIVTLADDRDPRGTASVAAQGTLNVVRSMQRYGLRRLIVLSSGSVAPPGQLGHPGFLTRLLNARSRNGYTADLRRMEVTVRQSRLDWTLVRAARLSDDPAAGDCRSGPGFTLPEGRPLSRTALAVFLLDELERKMNIQHAVAVAG